MKDNKMKSILKLAAIWLIISALGIAINLLAARAANAGEKSFLKKLYDYHNTNTEKFLNVDEDLGKAGGWLDLKIMTSNRRLFINQDCQCTERFRPTFHLDVPMWGRLFAEIEIGLNGKQDNPEMVFYGGNIGYRLTKNLKIGWTVFSELNIGSKTGHHGWQGVYGAFHQPIESGYVDFTAKYLYQSDYYNPHNYVKDDKPAAAYFELDWKSYLIPLLGVDAGDGFVGRQLKKIFFDVKPYVYFKKPVADFGGVEVKVGYDITKSTEIAFWHNSQHSFDNNAEMWNSNGLAFRYKF